MPITFPLNQWQKLAARTYGGGDFALYAEDDAEVHPYDKEALRDNDIGDTNFYGLMIELDETEDCATGEEAAQRVQVIIDDLEIVRDALMLVK